MKSRWFLDENSANEGSFHLLEDILYAGKSTYQEIEVIVTASYGKSLVLDGKVQSTEADEFIYHEALVHPAMAVHERPISVLIAGGGEGATAREALRYSPVELVDIVDLDREVIEISKKYLSEWHQGIFADKRVSVYYEDARGFIERSSRTYDIIIADLPEPYANSPALLLYTMEFYEAVNRCLNESGIFITQATSASVNNLKTFAVIVSTLKKVFPIVSPYVVNVPSFHMPWGFVLASKYYEPLRAAKIAEHIAPFNNKLRFYDEHIHGSLFCLPKYLRRAIEKETAIITDSCPVSYY